MLSYLQGSYPARLTQKRAPNYLTNRFDYAFPCSSSSFKVEYFGYDYIVTTRLTEQYPFYPRTNFQDVLSWRGVNVTGDASTASLGWVFALLHGRDK